MDESTTTQAPSTDASTSTDVTVVAVEAQSGVAPSTDNTYYSGYSYNVDQQSGTVTASSGGSLPVTGANSTMGVAAALAAMGAGTALVVVARRRRVPEAETRSTPVPRWCSTRPPGAGDFRRTCCGSPATRV